MVCEANNQPTFGGTVSVICPSKVINLSLLSLLCSERSRHFSRLGDLLEMLSELLLVKEIH